MPELDKDVKECKHLQKTQSYSKLKYSERTKRAII